MWPYTDNENAWLREPNHEWRAGSDPNWPTPEMVDLYIRRGEELRAEVVARAFARAGAAMRRLARRTVDAIADWRKSRARPGAAA